MARLVAIQIRAVYIFPGFGTAPSGEDFLKSGNFSRIMHRVIIGIDSPEDVIPLIQAGADEFFCGVRPETWNHDMHESPNARISAGTSLKNFDELQNICTIAHRQGTKVFFTLNAPVTTATFPDMKQQHDEACRAGADGIILSDLGLFHEVRRTGIEYHVSSLLPALNADAVQFLKDCGFSRIILSRHLTADEISKLPPMDYELFLLNEGCKNVDGYCRFDHGFGTQQEEVPACCMDYQFQTEERRQAARLRQRFCAARTRCGACLLHTFSDRPYTFKIVSRGHPIEAKIRYVKFAKKVLAGSDAQQGFRECFGYPCSVNDCYYPQ